MNNCKEVFVVVQEGVYRHDIHGPFTTFAEAVTMANEIARADNDNYHWYRVYKLDGSPPPPPEVDAALYKTRKVEAEQKEQAENE